jgi:hypothetical protein
MVILSFGVSIKLKLGKTRRERKSFSHGRKWQVVIRRQSEKITQKKRSSSKGAFWLDCNQHVQLRMNGYWDPYKTPSDKIRFKVAKRDY